MYDKFYVCHNVKVITSYLTIILTFEHVLIYCLHVKYAITQLIIFATVFRYGTFLFPIFYKDVNSVILIGFSYFVIVDCTVMINLFVDALQFCCDVFIDIVILYY